MAVEVDRRTRPLLAAESGVTVMMSSRRHEWSVAQRAPTEPHLRSGGDPVHRQHVEPGANVTVTLANREEVIRAALRTALADLTARFGPDPAGWAWGKLHTLTQKHVLSDRGDLGSLLDRSGYPMPGDNSTVFNATSDPATHAAISGAGYRMVADLFDPATLWAIEVAGASGHPGSPHYDDQIAPWNSGGYHELVLNEAQTAARRAVLTLEPAD